MVLIKALLFVIIPVLLIQSNNANKDAAKVLTDFLNKELGQIQAAAEEMGKIDVTAKITKMKEEGIAASDVLTNTEDKKSIDTSALTVTKAVTQVVSSIPVLVDGIKTKDWKGIVKGGLGIAASVAYFAGPYGAVISALLPLLNVIFDLFEDDTTPEESQEEMMTRVVEAAIEKAQIRELQSELSGVLRLYKTLSYSISTFRKTAISDKQVTALYNNAFEELVVFGKLKEAILRQCLVPPDMQLDKAKEKVSSCVEFLDLYCDLSIIRKLMLLDMAALLTNKFETTSRNLLDIVSREFNTDRELLKFLVNPVDYPEYRYAIARFYQNPEKHEIPVAYLDVLTDLYPDFVIKGVTVCREEQLRGDCHLFTQGLKEKADGESSENTMAGWSKQIKSFFVPSGLSITGFRKEETGDIKEGGPFIGPQIFPSIPKKIFGTLKERDMWISVRIDETGEDARSKVRICMFPDFEISGFCDTVDDGDTDIRTWHGSYTMYMMTSMSIPEDKMVTLYAQDDLEIGPFYGPDSISEIPHPEPAGPEKKKPSLATHLEALKKTMQAGWIRMVIQNNDEHNARHMVKLCTKDKFQGFCFRVPKGKYGKITDMPPYKNLLESEKIKPPEFKIKSAHVPPGLKLTFYSSEDFRGVVIGPFTGPSNSPYATQYTVSSLEIESLQSEMKRNVLSAYSTLKPSNSDGDNHANASTLSNFKDGISKDALFDAEIEKENKKIRNNTSRDVHITESGIKRDATHVTMRRKTTDGNGAKRRKFLKEKPKKRTVTKYVM